MSSREQEIDRIKSKIDGLLADLNKLYTVLQTASSDSTPGDTDPRQARASNEEGE